MPVNFNKSNMQGLSKGFDDSSDNDPINKAVSSAWSKAKGMIGMGDSGADAMTQALQNRKNKLKTASNTDTSDESSTP